MAFKLDKPQRMRAIELQGSGGPEVLACVSRPVPEPGKGEILVRVAAAGVNRPDILQRRGFYPPPAGAPDIPGLEIAGEVVATGDGARRYSVGDRVCALVAGGGYAEYCTVHASNALPVPRGLSMVEAAALPETFFTVWVNVFQRGGRWGRHGEQGGQGKQGEREGRGLQAGESVLVHGGTSGIGSTVILLAKAFNATVAATAGSEEKRQACLEMGADLAINYRAQDFVEEILKFTAGKGVDVVVDIVGGDYVARNYKAAGMNGRIIQIGILKGPARELDLMPMLTKRLMHTGSTLRSRSVTEKAEIAEELEREVWPLLEQGKLKPRLFRVFPLEEAPLAHALMESSAHIGKIVLTTAAR